MDELNTLKDGIEYYISDHQDPDFVEDEALFELIESKEEAKEKAQSKRAAEEAEEDDEDEDEDGDEDEDEEDEDEEEEEEEEEPDEEEDVKPAPKSKPTPPPAATKQQPTQPKVQPQPAPKQPEQPKATPPAAAANKPAAVTAQPEPKKNVPQTVQPSQPPQPQINFGALVNNTKAAAAAQKGAAVTPQTPTTSNAAKNVAAPQQQPAAAAAVAVNAQKTPATPSTPVVQQQPPAAQQQPTAAAVVAAASQKQQQQAAAAAAQKKSGPQQGIPAAIVPQQQAAAASVPKVQTRPQQGIPAAIVQQPKPLSYMEVIAKSNPNAAATTNQQVNSAQKQDAVQQPSVLDQLNEHQAQSMSMHHHLLQQQQHHLDASDGVMHDMAARLHALQMSEQQRAFADLQGASAAAAALVQGGSVQQQGSSGQGDGEDDINDETFGSAMVAPTIGSLEDFASQTIDVVHKDMPLFSLGLDNSKELNMLDVSLDKIPHPADTEQPKLYYPQNPYKTPECFPSEPTPLFNDPSVIAKMDTDTLFFIFYFQQNTYQQYLAAKELKRQAWRYHKKYTTWFQRHDTPKQTTNEFELGTYVYFDYESHDGWCQRIKSGFRFEYEYLEDENL